MTVAEAARRLNLGESSVYVLVQTGRLLCYRHEIRKGGRPKIDIGEHHLAAYLASVETRPPEPEGEARASHRTARGKSLAQEMAEMAEVLRGKR